MPRIYVRKTEHCSLTEDSMKRAIKAMGEKTLSIRRAAQMFNVPYGTSQDRLKDRFQPKKLTLGRKSVFSENQKKEIVVTILKLSKLFYGLKAQSIKTLVLKYSETKKITHPFNKEKGNVWQGLDLFIYATLSAT